MPRWSRRILGWRGADHSDAAFGGRGGCVWHANRAHDCITGYTENVSVLRVGAGFLSCWSSLPPRSVVLSSPHPPTAPVCAMLSSFMVCRRPRQPRPDIVACMAPRSILSRSFSAAATPSCSLQVHCSRFRYLAVCSSRCPEYTCGAVSFMGFTFYIQCGGDLR